MADAPGIDSHLTFLDADYPALIRSDRVSEQLRRELLDRARPDDPDYRPQTMTAAQFAALRALVDRVIPQDGAPVRIDLAARLDRMMATSEGNGWRYEALPTDPEAYNRGLDTLNAVAGAGHAGRTFAELSGAERDRILEAAAAEEPFDAPGAPFDAAQLALWFEEVRSDAARLYVAHPATMARLGYSGIANGGAAGAAFAGFERIGLGEREPFEPATKAETAA
ncbi:gluconate 2-dehydrogenase subunit 3 family protein [Aureimonas leprariae]|uniref:gluconate 2-dehydrogenase subunit 3 family protein n=1 Tax=Plantimonas leprariae TaxID=2615207 RepID=UPI00138763D4|nr:gluconate 2-dehydrogenase subunit 3 family protein [Aureimonas leprariae]